MLFKTVCRLSSALEQTDGHGTLRSPCDDAAITFQCSKAWEHVISRMDTSNVTSELILDFVDLAAKTSRAPRNNTAVIFQCSKSAVGHINGLHVSFQLVLDSAGVSTNTCSPRCDYRTITLEFCNAMVAICQHLWHRQGPRPHRAAPLHLPLPFPLPPQMVNGGAALAYEQLAPPQPASWTFV